jgi:large subunit ribosomal protein L15e
MGVLKIKGHFSSQDTAERRVGEKYPNATILGSYPLYEDGKFIWFEVILADTHHPALVKLCEYQERAS